MLQSSNKFIVTFLKNIFIKKWVAFLGAIAFTLFPYSWGIAAELHVGSDQTYAVLADAINAAQAGDIITIHAGEYQNVAVRIKKPLTIRGVDSPVLSAAGLNLNGTTAMPRAILELYGEAEGSVLEGLVLAHAANGGVNAAGVRLIGTRRVNIRHCTFTDNDNGIFASGDMAELRVENCDLLMNGRATTSHNVYLAEGESATFYKCRFLGTIGGQNLKSRVRKLAVLSCELSDSKNRELDLVGGDDTAIPGAEVIVSNCKIIKRWVAEQPDGSYLYVRDPQKYVANQHVIQLGNESVNNYVYNGTLHLLNNTIVTPFKYPVVSLTGPGAFLVADGNRIIRPTGVTGQGTTQQFLEITAGELVGRASGQENLFSPTFVDALSYGTITP